jgi:hypothetical protein
MTRTATMVLVLTLCTSGTISASNCDQALTVAASQLRTAPMVQDKLDYSTNDAKCRVVIAQFVDAVTARQAAVTCQDSVGRQRALKIIDAEI